MKELVKGQDLTTEIKLKDLYELLCDNEKLRKRAEELEERNKLLEQNVTRGDGFYINKINKKLSNAFNIHPRNDYEKNLLEAYAREGFITDSDIKKYWDECYCESEQDEQEIIDRIKEETKDAMRKTAEELGIWEEPKGLWPNGEYISLELSGLRFYDMYIYNALKRAGIKYIEELKDETYEWFTSLPNIGKGRADKLQDCLYRTWGFKLKEE